MFSKYCNWAAKGSWCNLRWVSHCIYLSIFTVQRAVGPWINLITALYFLELLVKKIVNFTGVPVK